MNSQETLNSVERNIVSHIAAMPYETPPQELAAGVMCRIRAKKPRLLKRGLVWLLTPKNVRMPPLAMGAAMAGLALLLIFWQGLPLQPDALLQAQAPGDKDTIEVVFTLRAESASQVSLIGSFNNWRKQGIQLTPTDQEGEWSVSLPLERGKHEYAFILNGETVVPDPDALLYKDDGFGNRNSVIIVDENENAPSFDL